jgi:hypothetical protein
LTAGEGAEAIAICDDMKTPITIGHVRCRNRRAGTGSLPSLIAGRTEHRGLPGRMDICGSANKIHKCI